ncbi:hypothetical protein DL98DRAFT_598261 [Cadophora sp. DSE1049]|nr:hypothetical protein DL98DRAFT_598261 [Cadophora sp. DSE1049]
MASANHDFSILKGHSAAVVSLSGTFKAVIFAFTMTLAWLMELNIFNSLLPDGRGDGAFSIVSNLFPAGLPIVVSRHLHAAKGHLQHLTNPHSHPRYPKVNSITKSTCLNIVSHEVSFSVSKHNVVVVSLNSCLSRAEDELQDLTLTFPKAEYLPSHLVAEPVLTVFTGWRERCHGLLQARKTQWECKATLFDTRIKLHSSGLERACHAVLIFPWKWVTEYLSGPSTDTVLLHLRKVTLKEAHNVLAIQLPHWLVGGVEAGFDTSASSTGVLDASSFLPSSLLLRRFMAVRRVEWAYQG